VSGEFDLLDGAARAMGVQRQILDIAARNVAAAQAATPGHPYERLVARFIADADPDAPDEGLSIVREAGTGDALTELIATLDAQRAYEANATIFETGKRLAERTLDIERS
jgi:flagellar basal body rod protein FlgC